MSQLSNTIDLIKYYKKIRSPKRMQRVDNNTYEGGNLGGVTITKKRKKPYWVSPRGAGNMTVMPGDPEMVFFAPIVAGAGIAASPTISSMVGSAMSGINTAGDALATTAAGQRLTSGLNFLGNTIGSSKAWSWIDAGLTSAFGAHGIDKVASGNIHNVGDAVETGLNLLPLSQLARPIANTASRTGEAAVGLKAVKGVKTITTSPKIKFMWNNGNIFLKDIPYKSNNFYRGVGRDAIEDANNLGWIRTNNPLYGGPYFGRGKGFSSDYIIEGTPESATWIDALHYDHTIHPPKVGDKYIDTSTGKSVVKRYTQQDINAITSVNPVRINNSPYVFPYENGFTTVPTTNFSYWLKYPIIGWRQHLFKTPNEPLGLLNSNPLIARGTSERWTPEQWTAAQDAAIARGDMAEAQRLRDLHFRTYQNGDMVDVNGNPIHVYHGSPEENITEFYKPNDPRLPTPKGIDFKATGEEGIYTSPRKGYAANYMADLGGRYRIPLTKEQKALLKAGKTREEIGLPSIPQGRIYDLYSNTKLVPEDLEIDFNPFTLSTEEANLIKSKGYSGYDIPGKKHPEHVVLEPNQLKSADAVTYDDNGVRIPLGERDNFKKNDIRYSWLAPFIGLGTLGTLPNRKQQ